MPFIVFEGCDGAGLTSQAGLLSEHLLKRGKKALLTKEPTINLVGGLIRAGLRKEWCASNLTIQLLYGADRAHHLETEIEPALKKNMVVICDRYILSTLAYGMLDTPLEYLKKVNMLFRKPDITFLLDVHPKISLERMGKARYHVELFETERTLSQLRENYLSLKNYFPNTFLIDANEPVEKVFESIKNVIDRKI